MNFSIAHDILGNGREKGTELFDAAGLLIQTRWRFNYTTLFYCVGEEGACGCARRGLSPSHRMSACLLSLGEREVKSCWGCEIWESWKSPALAASNAVGE